MARGPVDTEYYDILEVEVTCSETELKKSYRRLCLIHHPDKAAAGSDPAKFPSIQNAYECLSDPDQRADYDKFGVKGSRNGGGGGGGGQDYDEMFSSMFGGGRGGQSRGGRAPPPGSAGGAGKRKAQSQPSSATITVTLEELYNGKEKKIDIERARSCGTCKGTGAKPKTKMRPCSPCEGGGLVYGMRQSGPFMTRVPMDCPSCAGVGQKIRPQDACKKCRGKRVMTETKRVEFYLERGKLPGEKIILQNEGDESPDFSSPGDLHIMIELTPHPTFTLRPSINASSPASLSTTLSLTFAESLLGFSRLILIHLDGRGIRVNQPAPGQPGWRCLTTNDWVMVRAEGMWKSGMLGDLWIKIEVEMPDARWASKLDAKSLETLSELLPPKRMDVDNPVETDEVEFVKTNGVPPPTASNGNGKASDPMSHQDSDDDEEAEYDDDGHGPSCPNQ